MARTGCSEDLSSADFGRYFTNRQATSLFNESVRPDKQRQDRTLFLGRHLGADFSPLMPVMGHTVWLSGDIERIVTLS